MSAAIWLGIVVFLMLLWGLVTDMCDHTGEEIDYWLLAKELAGMAVLSTVVAGATWAAFGGWK